MDNRFIETGRIINTHGIRGHVKIEPWANSPEALAEHRTLYIGSREYKVISARVHGRFLIASLEGVEDIDSAEALKGSIVYLCRDDIKLSDGEFLIGDLIGLTAVDAATGRDLGRVTEILSPPGGDVCVIQGQREILVPLRGGFIDEPDLEAGRVNVRLIEGM